jgi:hypothetical protein
MVDGVNQQPGLFQRIGNFFGGDDPNAGQPYRSLRWAFSTTAHNAGLCRSARRCGCA